MSEAVIGILIIILSMALMGSSTIISSKLSEINMFVGIIYFLICFMLISFIIIIGFELYSEGLRGKK